MKIRLFKVYGFDLLLKNERRRKGFILEMQNEQGLLSYGEVSPLPGRSKETKEEALFALFKLQDQFIHNQLSPFPLPPSVSFGMESALNPLHYPINKPLYFRYTALSYGTDINTPCSQIKVKVDKLSWEETINLTQKFLKRGKRVILDFNKTWTKEKILQLKGEFAPTDLDGLEDPTNNISDLEDLYEKTSFPFHIDDLFSPMDFTPSKAINTIVVKPTLIGGGFAIKKIQEYGIPIRLSSSFETAVGLIHIMRIADTLKITSPLGIDTLNVFSNHLIEHPFDVEGENLILNPSIYNNIPIDKQYLTSCQPSLT